MKKAVKGLGVATVILSLFCSIYIPVLATSEIESSGVLPATSAAESSTDTTSSPNAGSAGTDAAETSSTPASETSSTGEGEAADGSSTGSGSTADAAVSGSAAVESSSGTGASSAVSSVAGSSMPEEERGITAQMTRAAPKDLKPLFTASGDRFLTGFQITDQNGNDVTQPGVSITEDTELKFKFDFSIPDDILAQIDGGDYYDFELPKEFAVGSPVTIELKDPSGVPYGKVTIGVDGKVHVEFFDNTKLLGSADGSFEFETKLEMSEGSGPGDTIIKWPVDEGFPDFTVNVKPIPGSSIDKQGSFDDPPTNPDKVKWEVLFNKGLDSLDNPVLTDVLPPGLDFVSAQVYKTEVDLNGNEYKPSRRTLLAAPGDYTLVENPPGTVTVKINGTTDAAYVVDYNTTIDPATVPANGGNIAYTNKATLTADNLSTGLDAEATVTAHFGKHL